MKNYNLCNFHMLLYKEILLRLLKLLYLKDKYVLLLLELLKYYDNLLYRNKNKDLME